MKNALTEWEVISLSKLRIDKEELINPQNDIEVYFNSGGAYEETRILVNKKKRHEMSCLFLSSVKQSLLVSDLKAGMETEK